MPMKMSTRPRMPPKRPARIVVTVGDFEEGVLAFAATDGLRGESVT